MSECNRSRQPEQVPSPETEAPAPDRYPADFGEEERLFADALRARFSLEREELPPLFVQTLVEDELRSPTVPGFEARVTYRVFRRLGLRRPPLGSGQREPVRWRALRTTGRRLRGPLVGLLGLVLAFVIASVVVATPSFAAGLRLLLGHTGVQQVASYPASARPSRQMKPGAETADAPPTNLEWLGPAAGPYTFEGAQVLDPQQWTSGSVVDLHYGVLGPAKGSGTLDIREFDVSNSYAAVLQVVQAGSATLETVSGEPAVYIDGTWVPATARIDPQTSMSYDWQSGVRSELLLERNGVILWIAADQRDGMNEQTLTRLAAQLAPTTLSTMNKARGNLRYVGDVLARAVDQAHPAPDSREIYHLVPVGSSVESGVGAFVAADS